MSARASQGQETLQHMCAKQWVCVPQRVTDVPVMRSCFSPGSPRVVLWSVSQVDLVPLGITAATMAPTQESHGWGSARPCRLTPHLLPSQEQPCLKDSASPVGAACEAPGSAVLPSTGPPQLDCPAGSPSPSIPVPGPKTPAPPASALSCVWRQKLTGRHRAPRWLPRSCLQAAPGQSGVELRFGPGRGLWGACGASRPFPKVEVTPGRVRRRGPVPVLLSPRLREQFQAEGCSLTLRKPSQGYLRIERMLLFTSCCEVQRPAGFPVKLCPPCRRWRPA